MHVGFGFRVDSISAVTTRGSRSHSSPFILPQYDAPLECPFKDGYWEMERSNIYPLALVQSKKLKIHLGAAYADDDGVLLHKLQSLMSAALRFLGLKGLRVMQDFLHQQLKGLLVRSESGV